MAGNGRSVDFAQVSRPLDPPAVLYHVRVDLFDTMAAVQTPMPRSLLGSVYGCSISSMDGIMRVFYHGSTDFSSSNLKSAD